MEVARAVGSLPVANVQALAGSCKGAVPERYIVKEACSEEVVSGDDSVSAIPVIDFGKLLDPRSSSSECAKLASACQIWGFFQVKKDGKWFAVDVIHGALVVNVGDALEVLSNGKFRSVEHRAVVHPKKERISVAMFHYPCQDLVLGPLLEFVTKGEKAQYKSTCYQEFMKQRYAAKLGGRDYVEGLKLK